MAILGADKSHFDSPGGNARAVGEGMRFITHKAGGDKDDAELAAWWSDQRTIDRDTCLPGAYWVLYPGNPVGRADAFLARLDAVCAGWRDRPWILQADCEEWGGNAATAPPIGDIRTFCQRLVAKTGGRLRPIVYAPKWVYGNALTGLGYPLWASSYVSGAGPFGNLYPGDQSSRWAAYSGQVPDILQYTSSATIAGQQTCDANAYRGTIQQLSALVAPGFVQQEEPVTEDEMNRVAQKTRDLILYGTTFPETADDWTPGNANPKGYRRSVTNLLVDGWKLVMKGTTAGGDPMPAASPYRAILDRLTAENAEMVPTASENAQAVVAALSSGTPEQIAATLRAVPGVDWVSVARILAAGS